MRKKRIWIAAAVVCVATALIMLTGAAREPQYRCAIIPITELDTHPQVRAFIEENDVDVITCEEALALEEAAYLDEVNSYLVPYGQPPVTMDELRQLWRRYGTERETEAYFREKISEHYQIAVEYDLRTWKVVAVEPL